MSIGDLTTYRLPHYRLPRYGLSYSSEAGRTVWGGAANFILMNVKYVCIQTCMRKYMWTVVFIWASVAGWKLDNGALKRD